MVTTEERNKERSAAKQLAEERARERRIGAMFIGGFTAIVLAFFVGKWVVSSSFEAATYNRLTGANVSTWDAMWVELRVQEPLQSK